MDRPGGTVLVIWKRGRRRAGHSTLVRYASFRTSSFRRLTCSQVRLTGGPVVHPTAGYLRMAGQFESTEPTAALVLTISGAHVSWTRTSHRGTAASTSIQFSPYDEEGRKIMRRVYDPGRRDRESDHRRFDAHSARAVAPILPDGRTCANRDNRFAATL